MMVQCQQIAFSGLLLGWGTLRVEVFQGVQKDDELLGILRISKIGSTTGLNKIENLCFSCGGRYDKTKVFQSIIFLGWALVFEQTTKNTKRTMR